jgi:hypothetical protein
MSNADSFDDSDNEDENNDIVRLSRLIGEANVCGLLKGVAVACAMVHPGTQLAPIAEYAMLRLIEFIVEGVVAVVPSESSVDVIQLDDIKRGFEAFLKPDTGLSTYALYEIDRTAGLDIRTSRLVAGCKPAKQTPDFSWLRAS